MSCLYAVAMASAALLAALPLLAQPPTLASGSKFMAAYLDSIARTTDPVVDIYLNRARAAGIRTLLGRPMSAAQELQLRVKIADELLKGGQTQEAIQEYEYVYAEIQRRGLAAEESFYRMLRDMLGIAYLRLGEQENCIHHHSAESCLLPIRGHGVHALQRGSRTAIKYYTANLEQQPNDLASRWLLNIAYMTLGEHPHKVPPQWLIPPSIFDSEYDIGRFVDIAVPAGVAVLGHAGGSVVEDLDGDGLLDIVASSRGLEDQLRLFRNQGDGKFADHTRQAGLLGQVGGLNMAHADYDNDGDRDLLVLRGAWRGEAGRHPNSLLQNQGTGIFADVTRESGVFSLHPTHSAAWGDYDNDGWLDLYVGNESSPASQPPHPCELYRSNGDGTFADVARAMGVDYVGFVKGVVWGDYNNDGMLDLYLSHLNGDNVLYRNNGDAAQGARFTDLAQAAGVQGPYVSFPTWFWDYDNDGWQDLLVAGFDMENLGDMAAIYLGLPFTAERVHLYRNRGDDTFEEVSAKVGLHTVVLVMGANFGDLDNDGYLDAYFGTGMPDLRALLPNRMFRNAGGERFQDVTTSGGFGILQKGHGISFGDLDNDGDQDIYQVLGAAFEGDVYPNVLFENPGHGNHWITLFLEGVRSNRDAIGARVRVRVRTPAGVGRDIHVTVGTGGSFGSSSLRQEIGLGDALAVEYLQVTWPATGETQLFEDLALDRAYRLREMELLATEVALKRYDMSP